jgi:hypothetical protein
MARTIPIELKKMQDGLRQESVDKVQKAINELKRENYIITTKLLMERTGFARSTFSKTHIQEVLKENKVCKYADTKVIAKDLNEKETIRALEDEILTLKKKVNHLEKTLTEKTNKENKLKVDLYETQEVNKKLRGQLHILVQKAKIKGLDIEN